MFYNEEVKQKFITDYMRSRIVILTSLTGLFNKTEQFERSKAKDCCSFTQEEIIKMYKEFGAKSVSVLENYNVHLKGYTAFCIHHGYGTENNYNGITKDILMECIDPDIQKQKFITREQLDDIENELYNYTDKAICESIFCGITGKSMEDLISLRRDMITKDKKYIILDNGKQIALTDKLYNYLDLAFSEKEYICYGATIKVKKLMGNDCLYKEMDNAYALMSNDKKFRWVYRRMQIYRDYVDMPMLTMKSLHASGLLHEIKIGMQVENLGLREFLYTDKGKKLAEQYGYNSKSYVDILANKYIGMI